MINDKTNFCYLQWTGKDDEVARAAEDRIRDVRDTASAKGREFKDSWNR